RTRRSASRRWRPRADLARTRADRAAAKCRCAIRYLTYRLVCDLHTRWYPKMADATHTFLFADLVGFTALAELEGDDRALEVALALQRRVRELLAPHHAEQVKG